MFNMVVKACTYEIQAVKGSLPHGEWGKWLEEKVEFTQRTANRFMKVANEMGNSTLVSNLGTKKLFMLLDVPEEEREEFIQNNPVNDIEEDIISEELD
jgi:hypothetical protein